MNQQAGIQTAPKKGGSGWLKGCGIVAIIVLIAVGGFAWWGINKAKNFAEKWGDDPVLGMVAVAVGFDPGYEIVSEDPAGGTITVKQISTGEVSTWRVGEFNEETEDLYLIDDQNRKVTMNDGESSDGDTIFVVGDVIEITPEAEVVEEVIVDEVVVDEPAAEMP